MMYGFKQLLVFKALNRIVFFVHAALKMDLSRLITRLIHCFCFVFVKDLLDPYALWKNNTLE